MCAAALQQIQLDATDLGAGLLLQHLRQNGGQTAQLSMAEAVIGGYLGLGDEAAVLIVDALGDGDDTAAFFGIDSLHVLDELGHTEIRFRQINEVGTCAVLRCQRRRGGQPAGVAAHDLHDHDHAGVIDMGVVIDLHHGRGDVLGRRGIAGAVVGTEEVVIDGLGYAHDPALVAHGLHIGVDFVAGIHGVVAAVIEEVADVMLLEHLQDPAIVGIVLFRVCDLIAAGAQSRGGSVFQQPQLLRILQPHVEQTVIQHALDAVLGAQHLRDAGGLQRRVDDTVGTGVDDRCRPAGLSDDAGTL